MPADSIAANNCLPPKKVRITAMHIDKSKRTAKFTKTAERANGFLCASANSSATAS